MKAEEIIEAAKGLLPSERLDVVHEILCSLLETVGEPPNNVPDRITEDWRNNEECIMADLCNTSGLVDFVYSHLREKLLFL